LTVPDSEIKYKVPDVRNPFLAPDWHPQEHPPMPEIVAHGRKPAVLACGYCHRATGSGGVENAPIAGLPETYFVQQLKDFQSGMRTGPFPDRVPIKLMIASAKAATDDEIALAAAYFSGLKQRKLYRVVESDVAPKTVVYNWAPLPLHSGEKEPIEMRIVEVPTEPERFESRDDRVQFDVYAPVGSLAKGKALVAGNGGKSIPCATCHGADLHGLGPVPPIAGRGPTYLYRQLYDFQHGERAGPWSPLMAQVVANLSDDDMTSIVAYLASQDP
jgi:cytochrome c553